jgi:hypothetical protein
MSELQKMKPSEYGDFIDNLQPELKDDLFKNVERTFELIRKQDMDDENAESKKMSDDELFAAVLFQYAEDFNIEILTQEDSDA